MNDETLTIGQVAKRAGLNASAIRYYEAHGLLPEPPRVSGQRRYGEDTLARLGVIDVAKRAGFTLDDIRVLLHRSRRRPARPRTTPSARPAQAARRRRTHRPRRARTRLARRPPPAAAATTLDVCALFAQQEQLPQEGLHLVSVTPGNHD